MLLPRSAAEEICALSNGEEDSLTGVWNLDIMFKSAIGIRENLSAVLENYGYQSTEAGTKNYLVIGVNWGYTGDRISNGIDPVPFITIVVILLLIIFTGYLIIYNIFQISVTNDIRFYGLLKTIGTTGKQLKRIVRQQALMLSLMGVPLGLILGFVIGNKLTPIIMAQLSYKENQSKYLMLLGQFLYVAVLMSLLMLYFRFSARQCTAISAQYSLCTYCSHCSSS